MARLISPPVGLPVIAIEPLAGPRTKGAGSTESGNGFVQTTSSPFGSLRLRISFAPMREGMMRAYRGWIAALHGGANATRWHYYDPDLMSPRETGLDVEACTRWDNIDGVTWSNGEPWSNGVPWAVSPPLVLVGTAAALNATTVQLANSFWGHGLQYGDEFGFSPFHFGKYTVTEVIAPGLYRIWPPLRKAITTSTYATLRMTLAMRMEGEEAANAGRGLVVAEGLSVTLVEVFDYDARDYFGD